MATLKELVTERQWEVVELVAKRLSNCQIAVELQISENTVRSHIHEVYDKVGADDRLNLMLRYHREAQEVGLPTRVNSALALAPPEVAEFKRLLETTLLSSGDFKDEGRRYAFSALMRQRRVPLSVEMALRIELSERCAIG